MYCVVCINLPVPVCRSKHTAVQCFYTGSERPALPACPAAAARPPAGSTAVCRIREEDCGYMVARMKQGWPAHTAGGGPASRCPWPARSGPGPAEDLRRKKRLLGLDNKYYQYLFILIDNIFRI